MSGWASWGEIFTCWARFCWDRKHAAAKRRSPSGSAAVPERTPHPGKHESRQRLPGPLPLDSRCRRGQKLFEATIIMECVSNSEMSLISNCQGSKILPFSDGL